MCFYSPFSNVLTTDERRVCGFEFWVTNYPSRILVGASHVQSLDCHVLDSIDLVSCKKRLEPNLTTPTFPSDSIMRGVKLRYAVIHLVGGPNPLSARGPLSKASYLCLRDVATTLRLDLI